MIRTANYGDFAFIHEIASRAENLLYIVDEDNAALTRYLEDPDSALVIWEHDGAPAGYAIFCDLTNPAQRTELRRLALLQEGRGLGAQFLANLIDYAFNTLQVNRIWLDVATDNPRARAAYEKAGFLYEGTLRQHWRRPAGDIADLHLYAILRKERGAAN
jgi:RimJ/RimL family protein N-acetyltransferase